jgi:hypothetical protein
MDVQIISALIEGGLGIFGLAVVGFLFWKVVELLMQKFVIAIQDINEASKENTAKQVDALNELAHSINRMRDESKNVCKAYDNVGKGTKDKH